MHLIKYFAYLLLSLLLLIFLYLSASIISSLIPVNSEWTASEDGVEIWLNSNGVHIDLVVPTVTESIDWRTYIPVSDTKIGYGFYPYIGFGWGDLKFYQQTPRWSDLTLTTTFTALFDNEPAAIRTHYYFGISQTENSLPIKISTDEYETLVRYILNSFQTDTTGNLIKADLPGYGNRDAFYLAKGTFSPIHTCNNWVNKALNEAGLPSAIWTPCEFGVMRWYQ